MLFAIDFGGWDVSTISFGCRTSSDLVVTSVFSTAATARITGIFELLREPCALWLPATGLALLLSTCIVSG
jgi:hypothetical protein